MANLDDLDLQPAPDPEPESRDRFPWGLIAVAALLVGVGLALGYWYVSRERAPERAVLDDQPTASAPAAEPRAPTPPLGGEPEPIDVPPLDASDPVVRELVRRLSQHPVVANWLTTDGLVRNFAVVVQNIAAGRTPSTHLRRVGPQEPFQVRMEENRPVLDERSYRRYDRIAEAAASIDPDDAARLYATLKPRIEQAYGDLGIADTTFDQALEQAIVRLLGTPLVEGPIPVEPKGGTGYVLADPRLENLTAAQKQLLRMGPENTRRIQESLRDIARALGIPDERLPDAQRLRSAQRPPTT